MTEKYMLTVWKEANKKQYLSALLMGKNEQETWESAHRIPHHLPETVKELKYETGQI